MDNFGDRLRFDLVVYHGDCSDGVGAAAAAKKKLGNNAEYFAGFRGGQIPDFRGRHVLFLDFSYKREIIEDLVLPSAKSMLVIDHHVSAMEDLASIPDHMKIFDMKKSGAMLSWEFFHKEVAPDLIRYIEDRDIWKWNLKGSREFSSSFSNEPRDVDHYLSIINRSEDEHNEFIQRSISNGEFFLQQDRILSRRALAESLDFVITRQRAYEIWGEHINVRGKIVNSSLLISEIGELIYEEGSDIAIIWKYDARQNKTIMSFRSKSIDVSVLARTIRDGGGHKNSAGAHVSGLVDPKNVIGFIYAK